MRSEMVGDGKGRAPERRAEGNDNHGNQNENHGIAQRNPLQRRLDEEANPGRDQHVLHGIESLAVQSVKHRPVRLLRGDEMSEDCGQSVGPPVPHRHQQQNNDQNSVRRKKKRNFAIGKTKGPGNLCRHIIGDASEENLERDPAGRSRLYLCRVAHSTRWTVNGGTAQQTNSTIRARFGSAADMLFVKSKAIAATVASTRRNARRAFPMSHNCNISRNVFLAASLVAAFAGSAPNAQRLTAQA